MSKLSKPQLVFLASGVSLVLMGAALSPFFNATLTRYVEGEEFRGALGAETATGLHLIGGKYEPIHRTGLQSATSGGFEGSGGQKTIKSISVHNISARFNALGIFRRRWELNEILIGPGEVTLQTYEPKPEEVKPARPWYSFLLPNSVYLTRIVAEPANILLPITKGTAGIFRTKLVITPSYHDFEYDGTGGVMKISPLPELRLDNTHLLVTKTLFTLHNLDLSAGSDAKGSIHLSGTAGLKDDKSFKVRMSFVEVAVAWWLPAGLRSHVEGFASGGASLSSSNGKLEGSIGTSSIKFSDARVSGIPLLNQIATLTGKESARTLRFSRCSADVEWMQPRGVLKNIEIEDTGKLRIEGSVSLDGRRVEGAIRLGTTAEYLQWLPKAEEVFTQKRGSYLWTTVHLEGTPGRIRQDLSPRIMKALEHSPQSMLGVAAREAGEFFKKAFGGN